MVEGSVNQFVQSKDGLLAADPKTPVLATNDTAGRISRPADFGPQHNSHVVRDVHTRTFTHRRTHTHRLADAQSQTRTGNQTQAHAHINVQCKTCMCGRRATFWKHGCSTSLPVEI